MYRDISWSNTFNQSLKSQVIAFINVYKGIFTDGANNFRTSHICMDTAIDSDEDVYCKRFFDYRFEKDYFIV